MNFPSPTRAPHSPSDVTEPRQVTNKLPPHLADWQLPPGWSWGTVGVQREYRHYQEVVDALGRSLSLVSTPDPAYAGWLAAEARYLALRDHPSIPTTYDYWARDGGSGRGPGYLRRWIPGEMVSARLRRAGPEDFHFMIQLLRTAGSALAYLHIGGTPHGAVGGESIATTPTGRLWMLGWEWALPKSEVPSGLTPDRRWMPVPPEWAEGEWAPTAASDQWQLAATCFSSIAGEYPPVDAPPLDLVCPDCPRSVAAVVERALSPDPEHRYHSMAAMLRALDRAVGSRTSIFTSGSTAAIRVSDDTEEARLRWATGEDYEVLTRLGSGTFGSVWRVRDLSLEREVALKMLHPQVASDTSAVRRFRREAQLAAQLAHPAIVPIYDWDSNAGVTWYTMELMEGGSLADLVQRAGPRPLQDIAPDIEHVLDGLAAAHANGIIHRDLKPENILVDRYRRWRIADFGVAKISGEELLTGTTGTPEFAAPEQLLGEPQGTAVDCFEVAAITAFLLSGTPPFGSGDGRSILARELSLDVDLSRYPTPVAEWLRRGLDPVPENRFTDAAEMRDAWRRAVDEAIGRETKLPWWRRWLAGDEESLG